VPPAIVVKPAYWFSPVSTSVPAKAPSGLPTVGLTTLSMVSVVVAPVIALLMLPTTPGEVVM
jgi:hypothetical protein